MKTILYGLLAILLLSTCVGCRGGQNAPNDKTASTQTAKKEPARGLGVEPLLPLPDAPKLDARKVALGKKLFHEPGISGDGKVSCASCHSLDKGGADGLPTSIGIQGQKGPINSPTVLNAVHNFVQFWDGRAATLEAQAEGPVTNPLEMGATWDNVLAYLNKTADYKKRFSEIYTDSITKANFTDAIANYERTLITPSRFDAYLKGDKTAISEDEKKGYELFKATGCTACHTGVNVGGSMYQKMGLVKDYFSERGNPKKEDLGRFNVTGKESDKHFFKVPSLRNCELTAPYFHDASRKDLNDAVKAMAYHQLGKTLSADETRLIVAFLKSLTGKVPESARPDKT